MHLDKHIKKEENQPYCVFPPSLKYKFILFRVNFHSNYVLHATSQLKSRRINKKGEFRIVLVPGVVLRVTLSREEKWDKKKMEWNSLRLWKIDYQIQTKSKFCLRSKIVQGYFRHMLAPFAPNIYHILQATFRTHSYLLHC